MMMSFTNKCLNKITGDMPLLSKNLKEISLQQKDSITHLMLIILQELTYIEEEVTKLITMLQLEHSQLTTTITQITKTELKRLSRVKTI